MITHKDCEWRNVHRFDFLSNQMLDAIYFHLLKENWWEKERTTKQKQQKKKEKWYDSMNTKMYIYVSSVLS